MQALRLVEKHFNQTEFVNNASAIEIYAKWATRGDGPGLWRIPSAENSSSRDNDYIVRQDLFHLFL
jgi:hypothetical protein